MGVDPRGDRAADGIRDGVGGLLKEHVASHGKVQVCGTGDGGGEVAGVGRWGEELTPPLMMIVWARTEASVEVWS